ncbi:MAG: hypothetical protein ACOX6Q_00470 [Candidatus Dojkabacteria bacterium]|jgi:hypothetical protein
METENTPCDVLEQQREIALDTMSTVPIESIADKAKLLLAPQYPTPLTEGTLENIKSSMESQIINGMSVVAARAFDIESMLNSDIPIHSVDYPVFSGLTDIATAYIERTKQQGFSPKKLAKSIANIAGEYLMHTTQEKGQRDTYRLLEDMISKRQFGILRLDSTTALSDTKATMKILRDMKARLQGRTFYSAVEIKPSEVLPTLESNFNAYNDLKKELSSDGLPLLISLDVRAIAPFFEEKQNIAKMTEEQKNIFWNKSEQNRIAFIEKILTDSPRDIGLIELSGTNYYDRINHSSPFTDKPSMSTIDMIKEKEKTNIEWGIPNKNLGIIFETHPVILRKFIEELEEKGRVFL